MTNYLSPEALANYTPAQLEELRAICHDALRVNRQKIVLATIGMVSAQETIRNIDAKLKAGQPESDPAA
jgi:hypothetical protein